jgi:hypothetical protein
VYYRYIVPNCLDSIEFSLCGSTTSFDSYIHVIYSNGSHIDSDDDGCDVSGGLSVLKVGGFMPGDTIYLVVEGYNNDIGTYTLQVTEQMGTAPTFTPLNDTTVCSPFNICINTTATTILWSNGATSHCSNISAPGTYIVSMINQGCLVQDTFIVTFNPVDAQFTSPDTVYKDSVVNFSANAAGLTYNWSFGPNATPANATTMSTSVQFGTVGNATATLIVSNGSCVDTFIKNITVVLLSALENQWNTNVSIYPNPNQGQFTWSVVLEKQDNLTFELLDITGKQIYLKNVSGKEIKESVQLNLSKGVYLWKVSNSSGFSTGKLIVE